MKLLALLLALTSAAAQPPSKGGARKENGVNDILQSSRDPKELLRAALELARGNQAPQHTHLAGWLWSPEFLARLDSAQEYASTGRRLRISMVLQALHLNAAPSAQAVLVHLTQSHEFLAVATRVDFLIKYSSSVRPVPDELVRFWDAHFQPDDGFSNLTATALVENATPGALRLLERKLADPRFEHDDKLSWIRTDIYAHRADPPVLLFCEHLIGGNTIANDLRFAVASALFDPKPTEWFPPATVVVPPPLERASAEAKAIFHRLGARVEQAPWATPALKLGVKKTLATLEI